MIKTKALTIFENFDQDQREFVNSKLLNKSYKPKRVIAMFNKIAAMDYHSDKLRGKLFYWMIGLGIFTAVTFFFGFVFSPIFFISFIGFLSNLFLYSLYIKHKTINLENSFRLFIVPLVGILKEEMSPESKIYLNINAKERISQENLLKHIPSQSSSYPQIDIKFYKSNWFNSQFQFLDESVMDLRITDVIRIKEKTKRNPRGKIKTKLKYKISYRIKLNISFSKNRYELVKPSKEFSEDENKIFYKITKKVISTNIEEFLDINSVLGTIASAYKRLSPKK